MYTVRLIEQPELWETFVQKQPYTLFVQSSHYGDFYRSIGESSWILGIFHDQTLVGGSLIVSVHAKRGNFLFVPYGPFLPELRLDEAFDVWQSEIRALGKKESYDFVRVSPFLDDTPQNRQLFRDRGFRNAPMHMLAETTWMLNLTPSEDELLAAMNKNHRNLIRRCLHEQVTVEIDFDKNSLAAFHAMHNETAKRHNFHRFSESYITSEFAAFASHRETALLSGFLPDKRLDATAVVMCYGTMACYRHGASYGLDKRLPVSYAIQWEAIRHAKQAGKVWYNFWGIAPDGAAKSHPFSGITHFKKGFGGTQKDLLRCQDLALGSKYYFNWLIETSRRIKRGF